MRRIILSDEDGSLFNQPLMPELYDIITKCKSEINKMLADQSAGFWIRFIVTFKSCATKGGYVFPDARRKANADEVFIRLVKILTGKKISEIWKIIEDIKVFYHYNYLVTEVGVPAAFMWLSPQHAPSLANLFGKAENVPGKIDNFPLITRFAGSLIECYQHWKRSPEMKLEDMQWTPPATWTNSKEEATGDFEAFLLEKWGKKLPTVLGMEPANIKWLNADSKKCELSRKESRPFRPHEYRDGIPELMHVPMEDYDTYKLRKDMLGVSLQEEPKKPSNTPCELEETTPVKKKSSVVIESEADRADLKEKGILQMCANCRLVEPFPRTFKRCKKCTTDGFEPKYYCSVECQENNWRISHCEEHKKAKKEKKN